LRRGDDIGHEKPSICAAHDIIDRGVATRVGLFSRLALALRFDAGVITDDERLDV
jgi:hypothetical protein